MKRDAENKTDLSAQAQHRKDIRFRHARAELFVEHLNRCMSNVIFRSDSAQVSAGECTPKAIKDDHPSFSELLSSQCNQIVALSPQLWVICNIVASQA